MDSKKFSLRKSKIYFMVVPLIMVVLIVCGMAVTGFVFSNNSKVVATTAQSKDNGGLSLSSSVENISDTTEYLNNELVIKESNLANKDKIVTIQNVQNFLNKGVSLFRTNITKNDIVLNSLGLPNEAIANLSEVNKSDILNSEYIKVATYSVWGDSLVEDSEIVTADKYMNLYTVLLRIPEKDHLDGNGVNQLGYKALFYATWLKMPLTRGIDCMAMSATNGAVWGNANTREANALFNYILQGEMLGDEYALGDDASVLYEYSGYTYAVSCNLPNSVGGRNYEDMIIMISSELCCSTDFNMFFAYGHKIVSGTVSIDSTPGISIAFGTKTKSYQGSMLSTVA